MRKERVPPKLNLSEIKNSQNSQRSTQPNYNPFDIPDNADLFGQHEIEERKKKENLNKFKHMSLAERACIKPQQDQSNSSLKRAYSSRSNKKSNSGADEIKPVSELRQHYQPSSQLIEEQREIFFSNLLISRHQQELDRLEIQKKTQEAKIESMNVEAREAQNRSRTTIKQYENMRNRDRSKYEEQVRLRVKAESQFKLKEQEIKQMELEIANLEETLHQFQSYDTFLAEAEKIYGKKIQTTQQLIDFFDKLEGESLFMVKNVDNIRVKTEGNLNHLTSEIECQKKELKNLDEQIQYYENLKQDLLNTASKPIVLATNENLEKTLSSLEKSITSVYKTCFQTGTSQNSIAMLQTLENSLENMTRQISELEPNYVLSKLKVINEEKRRKQREINQEKKNKLAEIKSRNIQQRAMEPIKKRTGRPVTARCRPSIAKRKDATAAQKEIEEKRRIEDLLYGPVFD